MKERHYFWYVEVLDSETNRVIAENFAENDNVSTCPQLLCGDGERRDLWSVNSSALATLRRNRASLRLRFNTFVKEGSHGTIRQWFDDVRPTIKSKKMVAHLKGRH